ncbi:hypothetical protein [Bradyrhizobium sp. F1.13.3]|uniref:hypothetical protein n=1 Tax=Bradyrhizobium sp. F1.13.3 TaxID=3156351 RepID=UPI003394235F
MKGPAETLMEFQGFAGWNWEDDFRAAISAHRPDADDAMEERMTFHRPVDRRNASTIASGGFREAPAAQTILTRRCAILQAHKMPSREFNWSRVEGLTSFGRVS